MIDPYKDIDLQDCPVCRGTGTFQEEGGWCIYVECLDCGAHTGEIAYNNDEERMDAARRVATTWNIGKVIKSDVGE